ncbi:MAG: saccharopine dehydrogenase NADP-binding domain-containing protein [Deltaproteobacteria bacterium]|nr:saccharopine dehydrogenase NADP-binding domain-containing protein [Deltaproteobacteria bacterium]
MKVVVVGGAGSMGQAVVRDLIKQEIFDKVVISDVTLDKERISEKILMNKKTALENVDLYEYEKLLNVISGAKIVVNCAGPFYKTTMAVVRAALEAKANYIDICDDYEATQMLLSDPTLNAEAIKSNIIILTGMGSDPGTNNILAKWYAEKMDFVEDIFLYWVVSIAEISGAAMDHSLHMIIGKVPQYINGELVYLEGGEGAETVVFLPPVGECIVRFVGHPQPLTLPKYIKGVRNVIIKGALFPKWVDEYIITQKEMGFLQNKTIRFKEVEITPYELTLILWHNIKESKDKGPSASALKVVVKGKKGAKKVRYTADILGRMAPGTGLPAGIAAGMIAKGIIKEKGVLVPEACVDPKMFLSEFIKRGAKIYEQYTEERTLDIEDL